MEGIGVLFLAFVVLVLVFLFFSLIPVGLWISAWAAGVRVPLLTLVAMRLRRVPPAKIIRTLTSAYQSTIPRAASSKQPRSCESSVLGSTQPCRPICSRRTSARR
jgi:uncharacterized protein YqfA (UPF0365 family)